MARYHYTESGLSNVWIENIAIVEGQDGDEVYCVPNINSLHSVIAKAIIASTVGLTGEELRFLRTLMGMTQAEMGQIVHKDGQSIGRWERGETPIDENAQTVIRLIAKEMLDLRDGPTAAEMSRFSIATTIAPEIRIDGSDPKNYRPIPRAA